MTALIINKWSADNGSLWVLSESLFSSQNASSENAESSLEVDAGFLKQSLVYTVNDRIVYICPYSSRFRMLLTIYRKLGCMNSMFSGQRDQYAAIAPLNAIGSFSSINRWI